MIAIISGSSSGRTVSRAALHLPKSALCRDARLAMAGLLLIVRESSHDLEMGGWQKFCPSWGIEKFRGLTRMETQMGTAFLTTYQTGVLLKVDLLVVNPQPHMRLSHKPYITTSREPSNPSKINIYITSSVHVLSLFPR